MRHVSGKAVTMNTGKMWWSSRLDIQIDPGGYLIPGRAGSGKSTGGFWPNRRPSNFSSLSGHRHSEGNYDEEEDRYRGGSGTDHQRRPARLGKAKGGRWNLVPLLHRRRRNGALRSRIDQGGGASAPPPFSVPGLRGNRR